MTRFSFKGLTTILAAGAVALATLGATATPASALGKKERDALGVLLGIGTLALIIDSAEKNRDRRAAPAPAPRPRGWVDDHNRDRRWDDRRYDDRRWDDRRDRFVPARCVERVRTHSGTREVISASCMRKQAPRVSLPTHCAFDIRGRDGRYDKVYGKSCVLDRGFRIAIH